MEDIRMKELLMQWKDTIVNTGKFLWANIMKFYKWMWKELKKFEKGATWITVVILGMLCFSIFFLVIDKEARKTEMSTYTEQIDSLQYVVDSLDFINRNEILAIKAGEYHMTPHSAYSTITKDSVASLLKELHAWYPDIIMAQIQTESGFGTSDVAKNSNNLLGMKKTNKRKTTQIKNQAYKGYGMYNNWESCVIDRVMWDYACFKGKKPSRETYIEHLNSCYAESSEYGNSMDNYSKKYMKYL